jgi:hypothetical protein
MTKIPAEADSSHRLQPWILQKVSVESLIKLKKLYGKQLLPNYYQITSAKTVPFKNFGQNIRPKIPAETDPSNRLLQGSPESSIHSYLFSKFNVNDPDEMKASTVLLADVLKDPLQDFAE